MGDDVSGVVVVGGWLQSICSGLGPQRAMQLGRQLSPAQIKLAFQFYRAIALASLLLSSSSSSSSSSALLDLLRPEASS